MSVDRGIPEVSGRRSKRRDCAPLRTCRSRAFISVEALAASIAIGRYGILMTGSNAVAETRC